MDNVAVVLRRKAMSPWWKAIGLAIMAVALFVAGTLVQNGPLSAAAEGTVGYVDVTRLIEEYLAPLLDEPLAQETARLQAELDQQAEGLSDQERQQLFNRYQALLNMIKQEAIDEHLPNIDRAVAAVARREQIAVVLERQAVLFGGVDLTELVLVYLRANDD